MFGELSGAALATALAKVDPASLDPDDALGYALAMRRVQAWATAGEAAGLSRMHATYPDPNPDGPRAVDRGVAVSYEFAAAAGCSIPSASKRLGLADALAGLAATMAALRTGNIDVPRALALVGHLTPIDDPALRRAVEERVLAAHAAAESGLTMRQWHVVAARAVAELGPDQAEDRQRTTRTDREVRFVPPSAAGGEAELTLRGPAEQLSQCDAIIDALARAWKREQERAGGCPHTLAQLRFDAAVFLLTHAQAGRVPAGIVAANVTLPASSLLGFDESPGDMDRVGPIPASVAREMFARAGVWRRLVTDPLDGHIVTQEVKSYTPTRAMAAFVRARAGGVCAARGCGATRGLQNDHDIPHPYGPTSADNLCPFCQTNHNLKTHGGWIHRFDPATGTLTQTSPLGRTYVTTPLPPPGSIDPRSTFDGVAIDPAMTTVAGSATTAATDPPRQVPVDARLREDRAAGAPGHGPPPNLEGGGRDPADLDAVAALHATVISETDYALIARLNAEALALLNGAAAG